MQDEIQWITEHWQQIAALLTLSLFIVFTIISFFLRKKSEIWDFIFQINLFIWLIIFSVIIFLAMIVMALGTKELIDDVKDKRK